MKKFVTEFKEFIARGNVVDMAVAVIIGGAFGKIVTSLVNDIIMPLVGLAVGGLNVADWKWVIKEAVVAADGTVTTAENALAYGAFIQTILDFLIIALCIFIMLKLVLGAQSKFKKAEEAEEAEEEEVAETELDILKEIRDSLKENKAE